jgi:hypothetical protein
MGLAFAYAGTRRVDLLENLTPLVVDTSLTLTLSAMSAIALAMVYVGKTTLETSGEDVKLHSKRVEKMCLQVRVVLK